jgi:hypothetical protein
MVNRNINFVNSNTACFLLSMLLFLPNILADHSAIINISPYPKEVYAGVSTSQNPATALTGNLFFHNGYYYLGDETFAINLSGDANIIKIVVTDRLKPITYKLSTNEGFELNLANDIETSVASAEQQNNPPAKRNNNEPQLLAKCFLLTKKDPNVSNLSWDIKIIKVNSGQPFPPDFSSHFLIPESKKQGGDNAKKAVFQNEAIFFVENAENVDIDIERPVPNNKEQGACQDALLPALFVRTDVKRVAPAKGLENFPFLKKMQQQTKTFPDKKVSVTIQRDTVNINGEAAPSSSPTPTSPSASSTTPIPTENSTPKKINRPAKP